MGGVGMKYTNKKTNYKIFNDYKTTFKISIRSPICKKNPFIDMAS